MQFVIQMKVPGHARTWIGMLAIALLAGFASCQREAAAPEDSAVMNLLNRYFSTWSSRDMEGYARCFDDNARIFFLAKDGRITAQSRTDFVHEQTVLHQEASEPMKEVPEKFTVQGDAKVKQAAVTWRLSIGTKQVLGTDFFTLRLVGGEWKIVSLSFYGE